MAQNTEYHVLGRIMWCEFDELRGHVRRRGFRMTAVEVAHSGPPLQHHTEVSMCLRQYYLDDTIGLNVGDRMMQ